MRLAQSSNSAAIAAMAAFQPEGTDSAWQAGHLAGNKRLDISLRQKLMLATAQCGQMYMLAKLDDRLVIRRDSHVQ